MIIINKLFVKFHYETRKKVRLKIEYNKGK